MGSKFLPANNALSLEKQARRMRELFPGFELRCETGCYSWYGTIQPLETSAQYRVRIRYALDKQPEVKVLDPKLEKRGDGGRIPHVYPGNNLCLYRPRKQEWTDQKYIADTIVPWTSLWLMFYEYWLVTGEWMGGGEHPEHKARERKPAAVVNA